MATTITMPETSETDTQRPELPDASFLEDHLPEWVRTPRVFAGYTAILGLVYFLLNYRPLWHTDLWGHLSYGRRIWQSGTLPSTEPLMPLSAGVPFIDTAWLSQLIGYGAISSLGVTAMQFLYAASITVCLGLLLWRFHQRSQSAVISLAGLALFAWADWQQLQIVRPQLAGLLCFVALLMLLTSRRWHPATFVLVPLLFALWANLHGSFPVGLLMLGCFCAGRAIDVLRRTRSIRMAVFDRWLRRYFLLAELAAVGTLLTPYRLALYTGVFSVVGSKNLADLVEWDPLTLRMAQGRAAAIVCLVLVLLYRFSPRRVSAVEALLLATLGAGALWTSRLILWWVPVASYYLVLHGAAVWRRTQWGQSAKEPSPRSSKWSIVAIGLAWVFFGFTPFGLRFLHSKEPPLERSLSAGTPVGAVEYLRENPPKGQIFNTYEWGDYLLWAGPDNLQVFAASHAHLIPRTVWQSYMGVIELKSNWERTLDVYGVNTIVLDTQKRGSLIGRLKRSEEWRTAYEDDQSFVFVRRKLIE